MKFCAALALLTLTGYLAVVLSFRLVDNSDSDNGFNDGYVNTTTITALNTHGFVKRQNPQALALVMYAISGIADEFNQQLVTRAQFTQDLVTILWNGNPNYNYIICHVDHDYSFQGVQGVNWDHKEIDVIDIASTSYISFDVVVGGAGTFVRHGDGGYINWAYIGSVASRTDVGSDSTVVFNAP